MGQIRDPQLLNGSKHEENFHPLVVHMLNNIHAMSVRNTTFRFNLASASEKQALRGGF